MKPKIYFTPGTCSIGSMAALGYAGIEYDRELVDLAGDRAALRKINPEGKVPTMIINDRVLTETPAILLWVARQAPAAMMLPDDPEERVQVISLMSWLASHLHIVRRRVSFPRMFAKNEATQQEIRELATPIYRSALEKLDGLVAQGRLAAPVLQCYALVFYNWSMIDKVPPEIVSNLSKLALNLCKNERVYEAVRLNNSPISAAVE